jgi:hypothetical protein
MPNERASYHCIGRGGCDSIWTSPQNKHVIKCKHGVPDRSLANDYAMNLRILTASKQSPPSTPLSIRHATHSSSQQTQPGTPRTSPTNPPGYTACRALFSERIPAFPRPISNKIADLCAQTPTLADFVKKNPADDHCLVRPILGRRRTRCTTNTSRLQRFSVRNSQLHVDQMEDLGLDVNAHAKSMALTLAVMHWSARVDANDVEFVPAPLRSSASPTTFQSPFLGGHIMWMLDFDCVREISTDEAGVE